MWNGQNVAVNGLPGIEMLMPASIEVKPVIIQDSPQLHKAFVRSGSLFGVLGGDIVIGHMNEKELMGRPGLGYLVREPF